MCRDALLHRSHEIQPAFFDSEKKAFTSFFFFFLYFFQVWDLYVAPDFPDFAFFCTGKWWLKTCERESGKRAFNSGVATHSR